jgi:hypothetical protein
MHNGIRTKEGSLKNCINCHANPKTNSVLGKDGFCESCHAYASVSIDCFSCHSSAPEKTSGQAAIQHLSNPHAAIAVEGGSQLTEQDKTAMVETIDQQDQANENVAQPAQNGGTK